jgi:hypothetical protein
LFFTKLAHAFKHEIAGFRGIPRRDPKEAFVGQRSDRVEEVDLAGPCDRFGRLEREAADEDGEPAKQRLLDRRKQIVAPGDGVPNGLLARWLIAGTAGQLWHAPFQAREQGGERQMGDAVSG